MTRRQLRPARRKGRCAGAERAQAERLDSRARPSGVCTGRRRRGALGLHALPLAGGMSGSFSAVGTEQAGGGTVRRRPLESCLAASECRRRPSSFEERPAACSPVHLDAGSAVLVFKARERLHQIVRTRGALDRPVVLILSLEEVWAHRKERFLCCPPTLPGAS